MEPDRRYGYAWLNAVRQAHRSNVKPKILLVSHDAHPHGAQILSLNIAKHLAHELVFSVHLIVLGEGRLLSKFAEYATVHRLDLNAASDIQIDALLNDLSRQGIRSAIVNTTVSGLLVPHLKRHGFSVVSLVHELPGILASYKLQTHVQAIAEYADKIVFAAPYVRAGFESFLGKPLGQAVIRPQGLYQRSWLRAGADKQSIARQTREQLGIPPESNLVMCAGYADRRKGFDLFVRIGIEVMRQRPDVYFLWVGHHESGFFEQSLALADEARMRDRFLFTGLVDEPQPYYLASDLYVLTSREDPFPSVVMEALDALAPVVAFQDCGGFDELLKRGCGVLVPKEDAHSFAQVVLELLADAASARAMAYAGRDIVERELSFRHYVFDLLEMAGEPLPRVSAIVPNYRYAHYLQERLKTITDQTLPLFELIVLDDCSPDDSVEVAREFLKECGVPWLLEVNPTNSGNVFRQWRKGLELARGEYVWIAEADDLADIDFLATLIPFFDDPKVVLAYCQTIPIDATGKPYPGYFGVPFKDDHLRQSMPALTYTDSIDCKRWESSYVVDGKEEIQKAIGLQNTIPNASAVLFRRQKALEAVQEAISLRHCGDWAFYCELSKRGNVAYSPKPLNYFRRHPSSTTHSNPLHVLSEALIITSKLLEQNLLDINSVFGSIYRRFLEYEWELRDVADRPLMHKHNDLSKLTSLIFDQITKIMPASAGLGILIVLPDAETGGGQIAALRLANELSKRHRVFLLSARPLLDDGNLVKMIEGTVFFMEGRLSSIAHLRFCKERPGPYETDISSIRLWALQSMCEWLKIDIILSNVWWADKLAYEVSQGLPLSWYIYMHGCYEYLLETPACDPSFSNLVKEMMKQVKGLFYLDHKNLKIFQDLQLQQPAINKVENCMFDIEEDIDKEQLPFVIQQNEILFCMCSRGIPEKGWREALQAVIKVNELPPEKRGNKKAKLVVIGASGYLDNLLTSYKNCLEIVPIGMHPNPTQIMQFCDVGLLPSYFVSETQPNVLIEYMASRLAVIATHHAGIPAMLEHQGRYAGITVQYKDRDELVDRFVENMAQLMLLPEKLSMLQENAMYIFRERFHVAKAAQRFESVFLNYRSAKKQNGVLL